MRAAAELATLAAWRKKVAKFMPAPQKTKTTRTTVKKATKSLRTRKAQREFLMAEFDGIHARKCVRAFRLVAQARGVAMPGGVRLSTVLAILAPLGLRMRMRRKLELEAC
jgi:hypothetical protein